MKLGVYFVKPRGYLTSMDINHLNIDPIAFSIGPLVIRWYALAYLAGFLLGWRYCLHIANKKGGHPNKDDIDDFLTWAVIGVILGGRLGYVLFYQPTYFLSEPLEALKIWNGGMSFHGGVLGVIGAMVLFAKKNKVNLFKLSDYICAAAPIGLFFGRIANYINGELYGIVTGTTSGVVFPNAGIAPRHPSQLYEAFLEGIVLFILLWILTRSSNVRTGTISAVFLLGYGVFRMLIEFVREPDEYLGLIGGYISMGQILCIPMIAIGLGMLVLSKRGKFEEK